VDRYGFLHNWRFVPETVDQLNSHRRVDRQRYMLDGPQEAQSGNDQNKSDRLLSQALSVSSLIVPYRC
jgi:hypothetical protein